MNATSQFSIRQNQSTPQNISQSTSHGHSRQQSVNNHTQQTQKNQKDEKLQQQFQTFIRKLDASNSVKSRVQTIRDLDQFIQKKNQKVLKYYSSHNNMGQGNSQNSSYNNINNPSYTTTGSTPTNSSYQSTSGSNAGSTCNGNNISNKYEFPFCLSAIIVKISDLILNPKDVKKDQKIDIDNLVMRCFFQQRCLVYKLPQFLLNFMEQYHDPQTKLAYIKYLTNEGLEVDPSFNTQLFIILLKLIDTSLKQPQYEILSFLKNILDYNPKAFTEPQTLSLLLRISLVGISSINQNQTENSMEVCQILQYLLKYNDYSPKLLSASLLTMCVLSNREPFTFPIWNILKHIIIQDKKFIFQELLEILQIPLRCQYFELRDKNEQQLTFQQAIKKEIQFKCFKEQMTNMVIEFDDLQYSLSFHNQPTILPSAQDCNRIKSNPKMTIHELICRNKCDMKFYDIDLWEDVQKVERLSQNAFAFDRTKLQDLINILQDDRNLWINTFEKNIDRVQKGAIFFVGKILWSQDRIEDINYPINQILTVFNNLINKKTKFNVISEIFGATKQLVINKFQTLYFEWQGILQIMDSLTDYLEELINKKRVDSIYELFKIIRNQLLINRFPDFLEPQVYRIYLKYKNQRIVMDKNLTQLAINYMLNNDFICSFQLVIESCLTNERSAEIRSLFLDMLNDFYEDCEDVSICTLLEAVFANNIEYFYLTRKEGSYTTAQIIQIIDMLVVMGCKTTKSTNFRHITQILSECINCFEFDRSNMQNELNVGGHTNVQQIKQNLLNKGTVNYLNSDQIKMKSFQSHALTRMIQLFILKSQTVEYEKSIYAYNILLTILKLQSNDRRIVICNELLVHLKINTYKELCWQTTDNPIFIDIQKLNIDLNENENRSQGDSQGNSSGASNNSAGRYSMLFKHSGESGSTYIGRSSLNKLLEEKYVIQNTLKALISCIEDDSSSHEIKLQCLKIFSKFVPYLQDDDFLNLELLEHDQQQNKRALQDGKNEWIKMVNILLKCFDPLEEPEYSYVILDIFQSLLSLQNYNSAYPLLTLELHQLILEQLIKSISFANNYIVKYNEQEFLKDPNAYNSGHLSRSLLQTYVAKFQQMGGVAGQRQMQRNLIKASRAQGMVDANGNIIQDGSISCKQLTKFMKKAITIIGYAFTVDNSNDHRVWVQNVSQSIQIRISNQDIQSQKDQKLIEYLIDQLSIIVMNDFILPKLSQSLLVCILNIAEQLSVNQESLLRKTLLSDYLMYINTRIAFPYMLSRTENSDPFTRFKTNLHKMNKNLRDIFKDQFHTDDLLYAYYMLNNQDCAQVKMQMITTNMLLLYKLNKNEESLNSILTLVSQKIVLPEREKLGKEKNKELRKREKYYQCFIDCLSTILVWQSHSVYDRNCDIALPQNVLERDSGVYYFIWNRNLITIAQNSNVYDLYVRNPVFNYHAEVKTFNKVQQMSKGNESQISKLKALVRGQDDSTQQIKQQNNKLQDMKPEQIVENFINNDNTLMALIEPNSLLQYKKTKELLLCEEDQTLRNYIQILDMIQPKDCYQISIYYIPKNTDPQMITSLSEIDIIGKKVSKAHFYFLSMLGQIISTENISLNHKLYLKNVIDDKQNHQLIINEDNLNYLIFMSNVLNHKQQGKSIPSNSAKICIIYNESNIDDFTKYDPSKIYLIFSKLNENSYLFKIQHTRNMPIEFYLTNKKISHSRQQSQNNVVQSSQNIDHRLHRFKSDVYGNGEEQKTQQISDNNLPNMPNQIYRNISTQSNDNQQVPNIMPTIQYNQVNYQGQQQIKQTKDKKYQNGFYCEQAIVPKEKIGDFVKQICILSDMADRKQRYGQECIISNLIQRGMKIKEIKEKKINNAKFTTILKQ